MPSITVPLLSDHKKLFVCNRLFETLFGGPRFFIGCLVPSTVYIIQILVHQFPFLIGTVFTILTEKCLLSQIVSAGSCGAIMTLIVGMKQIITIRLHTSVSPVLQVKPQQKAPIVLEDDIIINESYFNADTARQLFPKSKFYINYFLHSALSGILTGYGVVYLSPSRLSGLYTRSAIVYIIFIMGWMTHCIALYSLSVRAPAETATFQPLDRWEIKPLMRPFYVAVCYTIDLISWVTSSQVTLNATTHILFVFLPLMWFFNLLPPLEALFLWSLEQVHVWVAGGSPAANTYRLLFQLVLWILTVMLIFFLPKYLTSILSAVLGYLLSLDLGHLVNIAITRLSNRPRPVFLVSWWQRSDAFFFLGMFLVVLSIALSIHFGISTKNIQSNNNVVYYLGWIILTLLVLSWLSSSCQMVYIFGGMLRNCLYPSNVRQMEKFVIRRLKLKVIGQLRSILTYIVAPLVLNVYVALLQESSYFRVSCDSVTCRLGHSVTVLRAFRWHWQQTESALFEVTVVYFVFQYTTLSEHVDDETVALLFAALISDRLRNLISKLHTYIVLLMASVAQEKQRRPYSCLLFGLNLIFFPLVFSLLVISAIIASPLLPLFTLPIFWIGFPRPVSFWPKEEGSLATSCQDAIYYEELIPGLMKEFSRLSSIGSLGELRPGDDFLLRYDDRLIWLSVLERGYGHCCVTAKGLELQQTSCHAVEASAIDAILDRAFEMDVVGNCGFCNKTPFHIYHPLTTAVTETYVDTRNVLTGLIHSPETLQLISDAFPKCLIWLLLHRFTSSNLNAKSNDVNKSRNLEPEVKRPSTADRYALLPKATPIYDVPADPVGDSWLDEDDLLETAVHGKVETRPSLFMDTFIGAEDCSPDSSEQKPPDIPMENAALPGGIEETIDSGWSFSENKLTKDKMAHFQPGAPQLLTDTLNPVANGILLPDFDTVPPAKFISKPVIPPILKSNTIDTFVPNFEVVKSDSEELNEPFPREWLGSPISDSLLYLIEPQFPTAWFKMASGKIGGFDLDKTNAHYGEKSIAAYRRLVCTCHSIVNQVTAASAGKRLNVTPSLVHRIFNREIPWSPLSDWLVQHLELYNLVIHAYRYACKVALDEVILGGIESDSEFMDYLLEYDRTWFIGADSEPEWMEAVKQRVPNLFSMGYNPSPAGAYTSHLLTRNLVPVYIGKLNREAARAVWSSLSLELLYLTNDDEERYSIQAHSGLLRNLTVQGADPPLGYPVYISKNILIKTLPNQAFCDLNAR